MSPTHGRRYDGDAPPIGRKHQVLGILLEKERRHDLGGPDREQQTGRAPNHGDEHALRQHVSDEVSAPGAQRETNGRLVRPGGGARHQKRRHVGACDQEYGGRRDTQQAADARQAGVQFGRHARIAQHDHRVVPWPSRADSCLRPIDRHISTQPAEDPEVTAVAIDRGRKLLFRQRHPDIDRPSEVQTFEPLRRDARHWSLHIVEPNRVAANVSRGAELRLPQAMAHDDAATRRELEDIRKLRRDGGDGHHRPDVRDHDLGFRLAGRAELLEHVAAGSKRQEFFVRDRPWLTCAIPCEHRHDGVGGRKRQITTHQPADEAVHRGVAADAQGNREHQRERHARRPGESPRRILEIFQEQQAVARCQDHATDGVDGS